MRLLTFLAGPAPRVGALVRDTVVDVTVAYAEALAAEANPRAERVAEAILPPSMRDILEAGPAALEAVRRGVRFVEGRLGGGPVPTGQGGARLAYPLNEVR